MKKLIKIISILTILMVTAVFAGELLLKHKEEAYPIPQDEPIIDRKSVV